MAPLTPVSTAPPLVESSSPRASPPAFDEVFRDHAEFVWRVARSLGVAEADLDDVCQEVFVVVHRRLAAFEGLSSVRTWIGGICFRVASDYRKRAHRTRERPVEAVPDAPVPADQDERIDRARALAWLDGVLEALDESKRAAFVLFEIEELPMSEVATILGCPLQTAYARLYAARKHVEAAARRAQAKGGAR